MKENMELERKDLVIDRDMEVDCDIGQQITCYIETWFDVDEKFRIKTDSDNDRQRATPASDNRGCTGWRRWPAR